MLVIGQDPATHEAVSRRILVGEAGQRVQGLLAKLGITSSYVMVNVYLYSVFGQAAGYRHVKDAGIVDYRHRWLDAVLLGSEGSEVTAVIALGTLAKRAFALWEDSSPERAARAAVLHIAAVRHPTYAEGFGHAPVVSHWRTRRRRSSRTGVRSSRHSAAAVTPEGRRTRSPTATRGAEQDLVAIPEQSTSRPALPTWWRAVDAWAVRQGADAQDEARDDQRHRPEGSPYMAGTVKAAAGRESFEEAYSRGITDELPPPPRRRTERFRRRRSRCTGRRHHAGRRVVERLRHRGGRPHRPGRRAQAHRRCRCYETEGVILPGLLDLHGHPEFNVFAAWEPPKLYANRYAWRRSKPYKALVRDPQNVLLDAVPPKTQTRYAEVRALVGGVTGIQGASGASSARRSRSCATWTSGPSGPTARDR